MYVTQTYRHGTSRAAGAGRSMPLWARRSGPSLEMPSGAESRRARARRVNRARAAARLRDDVLDRMLEETFPASDPVARY